MRILICCLLLLTAARAGEIEDVERNMLRNERDHGFDGDARINGGLGGLWINWRQAGGGKFEVNLNGLGVPDDDRGKVPRHDPLTDLRYLHGLYAWHARHPEDREFDADLSRYTAIVKREFGHTHDERGWLYDELVDLARLARDDDFREAARGLAAAYLKDYYHADIGAYYKNDAHDPAAHYRVDLALEAGCALIQAGIEFRQPGWTRAGERIVDFVYAHAYLGRDHLFLGQMSRVRLPDGSANPNEAIYRHRFRNYVQDGGVVRFGGIGQMAISLAHVALATREPKWIARLNDLLGPLTARQNDLKLWDPEYGGYFNGVDYPGPDFLHPGVPVRQVKTKESGRQFHMLQAYHVASALTDGRYRSMEAALTDVLLHRAYHASDQGIWYETLPDWSPRPQKRGVGNWVTAEAMGCSLLALFSLDSRPVW